MFDKEIGCLLSDVLTRNINLATLQPCGKPQLHYLNGCRKFHKTCCGDVLANFWQCSGELLVMFWRTFWRCSGELLAMFWRTLGNVLANFWQCSGELLAMFWQTFGNVLANVWQCSGELLAMFWQTFLSIIWIIVRLNYKITNILV